MESENSIPSSRSEWATVPWQESQSLLANLLNSYHFMKFEELTIAQGSRADIVVIRKTGDEIVFGVVEVKTFSKINSTIEKHALHQVCRYINELYTLVSSNSKWGNKKKRFFGSIVYTNDYPITDSNNYINRVSDFLPDSLIKSDSLEIFASRPEELIQLLQKKNLCGYSQNSLNDYFG